MSEVDRLADACKSLDVITSYLSDHPNPTKGSIQRVIMLTQLTIAGALIALIEEIRALRLNE